jgi:hypothetical protein
MSIFRTADDHLLFAMQFMRMLEDFQAIIKEDECPACSLQTRSNLICLNDECDWMLFPEMGQLHPATIPWIESLKERLS